MSKLINYLRLPKLERKCFHQALVTMLWVKLGLTILPHAWQRKLFYQTNETGNNPAQPVTLKAICLSITRCAKLLPSKSPCLVNALTAKQLLKWHQQNFQLYLGVRKSDAKLEAHAWLTSNDLVITGGNNCEEEFTVVSVIAG